MGELPESSKMKTTATDSFADLFACLNTAPLASKPVEETLEHMPVVSATHEEKEKVTARVKHDPIYLAYHCNNFLRGQSNDLPGYASLHNLDFTQLSAMLAQHNAGGNVL